MTETQHDSPDPAPASTEARAASAAGSGDSSLQREWLRPIIIYAAALALGIGSLLAVYYLARPLAILLASIIIAIAAPLHPLALPGG